MSVAELDRRRKEFEEGVQHVMRTYEALSIPITRQDAERKFREVEAKVADAARRRRATIARERAAARGGARINLLRPIRRGGSE